MVDSLERSSGSNKDNKQNVPELRFPEFKDEWVPLKLSDVADVRDGTHDSPKYVDKGFPLITSKNLLENGNIDFDNVNCINEKDYVEINKRSEVALGDILFGMIGTIGNPVLVKSNKKFAIKNIALIKEGKKLKNSFLIHYLNSNNIAKQFYKYNAGGTQKFIALGLIRNLNINTPSINEQKRIGDFLTTIDKKIELMEKKYNKLLNYAHVIKYLLLNTEDKDNLITINKLIDYSSSNLSLNKLENNNGKYPLYGADGFVKNIDFYDKDEEYIAIVKDGNGVGRLTFNEKQSSVVGTMGYLTLKKSNNLKYIFYSMSLINLEKYVIGSTIPHIYFKDYGKEKINLISLENQNKIVNILELIDNKICMLQKELEITKKFKKSLLSKMFC